VFLADLTIALGLSVTWMVRDAKSRGASVLPYVVLTVTLGSVGTLLYLLQRSPGEAKSGAMFQGAKRA
jgi:hypothetical protein